MDEDLAFALQLEEELNKENGDPFNEIQANPSKPLSIIDPMLELIDPAPDIRVLFVEFNKMFFDDMLGGVEVIWSSKMTLCAGLCCYQGRGGLCTIKLSTPLLKLRPRKDLVETLLHEMIHALLFVTNNNKDHDGHGPEFHKHMYRINKATGTNISVYHTFHDEVDSYRQHWWRCDGPCVKRPPFYGIVRRAMNRPPSPRDTWWSVHQQKCGGTFTKIKEPEGYGTKKSKKELGDIGNSTSTISKTKSNTTKDKKIKSPSNIKPITDWFNKNTPSSSKDTREHDHGSKDKGNPRNGNDNKCINDKFSTSLGISNNIMDFKKLTNDNSDRKIDLFSGQGHVLISSNRTNQSNVNNKTENIKAKRDNFLKRLENKVEDNNATKKRKLDIVGKLSKENHITWNSNNENKKRKDSRTDPSSSSNENKKGKDSRTDPSTNTNNKKTKAINAIESANKSSKTNNKSLDKSSTNKPTHNPLIIINDDFKEISSLGNSNLVDCPACPAKIPMHELNQHLDICLS